jgi:hypothetical protein
MVQKLRAEDAQLHFSDFIAPSKPARFENLHNGPNRPSRWFPQGRVRQSPRDD